MIDLARIILQEEKKALHFKEIYDRIAEIKGYAEKDKEENISQFYTDLNVHGRFMTLGSNMWGLKRWYPAEQIDEDITNETKKKKKSKKKKKEVLAETESDIDAEDLDIIDGDVTDIINDFEEDEDEDEDFDDLEDDFDDFDEDEDEEDLEEDDLDEEDEK